MIISRQSLRTELIIKLALIGETDSPLSKHSSFEISSRTGNMNSGNIIFVLSR